MFAFWGRRGGVAQLALDLARVAVTRTDCRASFSISDSNELFEQFAFLRDDLFAVRTFSDGLRGLLNYKAVRQLQSQLRARLVSDRTRAFVSLLSHVWSPFMTPVIRAAGVRHVVVVHDADPHPGDWSARINWWLIREARSADRVITLSQSVAHRLTAAHAIPTHKISVLFHPDLEVSDGIVPSKGEQGLLRVLFLGRIKPYKGLDLLIDAIEILRDRGVQVNLGVFGEGEIAPNAKARLSALRAEVENDWLDPAQIKVVLSRYDVVAASHVEASQSGVVAAAFGAGLPVVVTPVGGLVEQVAQNITGVIAESSTGQGLANAIASIANEPQFLARLQRGVAATSAERSAELFLDRVYEIARGESL